MGKLLKWGAVFDFSEGGTPNGRFTRLWIIAREIMDVSNENGRSFHNYVDLSKGAPNGFITMAVGIIYLSSIRIDVVYRPGNYLVVMEYGRIKPIQNTVTMSSPTIVDGLWNLILVKSMMRLFFRLHRL